MHSFFYLQLVIKTGKAKKWSNFKMETCYSSDFCKYVFTSGNVSIDWGNLCKYIANTEVM